MTEVLKQQDGVIDFSIKINGKMLKDTVEIDEIKIHSEVNKVSNAIIKIRDGGSVGVAETAFDNSEGSDFLPGNEIEISLGYGSEKELVFKGIISSQRLVVRQSRSQLIVTCKDKAIKMTKGRHNGIFKDQSDTDTIKKIAGGYGLKLDMDVTEPVLPVNIQYNCSDWDFLLIRAEMNNMVVVNEKNELRIKKHDFNSNPKYEINTSINVLDIDLNLDSEHLSEDYTLTSWNDREQQKSEVNVSLSDGLTQGNISAKKLSNIVFKDGAELFTSASLSKDQLKNWGETLATKAVLSKIKGTITIPGHAGISAAELIDIKGFSKRFNGKAFISSVEHNLAEGNWITILEVGKSVTWQSAMPDVEEIPASGLIPAVSGFQIGKVKKIDEDPEGKNRVLVTFPTLTGAGQEDGLWVRQSFPYASQEAGFFFFPEIDDEVIVGFINNDPRYGIITGSVYNGQNKPKETPDDKNRFKSIHSRSGIKLRFDDEDRVLEIETPDGNSIKLDEKENSILIKDTTGNKLQMDDSGITLDSAKDISLSAKGNIDLSATSGINLKANSDLTADGANIQLSAKAGFMAKGNATAEISASGQTTVKGAMVMIN